ncbi:MAG: hypothetical protein ACJ782_11245, partial [Actinomycetota bacterium]
QILLVIIALVAVAVAGWALGSRGGYGQPGTDPVAAEAPSPPRPAGLGWPGTGRPRRRRQAPSGNVEPTGKPAFKPEIQGIWTVPATLHIGQALHLPPGPARVTFRFDIDHATRAQFWLAHGTQVDKTAIWLGEDSYTANGWSVGMRYGDDGFTDNLIIRATGPGGTAEEFVGVTNNGGA